MISGQTFATSYDQIPYPNLSYASTHPDRLATLATLLGLEPGAVDDCRVLELGCAAGGNLLPMAYALPGSDFVGVDYSERQIDDGRNAARQLGLQNVELIHADILDLPSSLGAFDYIIAHGVYSWVPPPVRDKLLAICRGSLTRHGVAYVSYNTYPGWHRLNIVRDMMLYRTRGSDDPHKRVEQVLELIDLVTQVQDAEESTYFAFLKNYKRAVLEQPEEGPKARDAMLLHDVLEAFNQPVHFHEFAEHAAQHDLQYLSEASLTSLVPGRFPREVIERLRSISSDIIELEQYLDFFTNKTFRQTLLCHKEVRVDRTFRPEIITRFKVASQAKPVSESSSVLSDTVESFQGLDGAIFETDHPLTKAAFLLLDQISPAAIDFNDLYRAAADQVGDKYEAEFAGGMELLATNLLKAFGYSDSLVEIHVHMPDFITQVSKRPVASKIARWQALSEYKVTNLRHERVKLDPFIRPLLPYVDGAHDHGDLLSIARDLLHKGEIDSPGIDGPEPCGRETEMLSKELGLKLHSLGRSALLEA